jgi:hypothetical protein
VKNLRKISEQRHGNRARVMGLDEFDGRRGVVPRPSLVGTSRGGKILSRSQQRVTQLVSAGQMLAVKGVTPCLNAGGRAEDSPQSRGLS